jgi:hypothetical protein
MIASELVVGSAIRGSEIDVLVASIGLETEGDANESTCVTRSPRDGLASQIYFNCSISKRCILDHRIRGRVYGTGRCDYLNGTAAFIVGLSNRHIFAYELIGTLAPEWQIKTNEKRDNDQSRR